MTNSVRKIPILRFGLIVSLISILFFGAFYLYLHYQSAKKLQNDIGKLIAARKNSELVDNCLLMLYKADNNSRLYALTNNEQYVHLFNAQIDTLGEILDKIKATDKNVLGSAELKTLINQKKVKTHHYVKLRQFADSLMNSTLKNGESAYTKVKVNVPVVKTVKTVVHLDTIKPEIKPDAKTADPQRKKFFGRVLASISGKKNPAQASTPAITPAAPIVVKRDTQTNTTIQTRTVYTSVPQKTDFNYQKLLSANNRLRSDEHAILLINNDLFIDIISQLKQYKSLELAYSSVSKQQLAGRVQDVFNEYSLLSKLTVAALVLLLVIVLYNIWKIFHNGRELIEYSEKAEQYANNKSKFMASMSHEIRTPLNSVIGFSEQLGMSKLNHDQIQQINAIRSSSHMLLEVVNEILDFSKYETGKMNFEQQPFIPYNALNDVFNAVAIQAAKKGLSLRKSILFDENICFNGDMLRMKQVVMNLMVNAIKFTSSGEVFLQAMLLSKKNKDEAVLKIRIKDTGIGIKKQDLPMIFDEFAQVNEAQKVTRHKGTGLGLAICKKIVELQGGRIAVISEPGKGSVFSFEIPFKMDDKENCVVEPMISDDDLAQRVYGAHVLVVDDNQLNVLLAKTILKKWRITCDTAYDGQEALNLFEERKYDLVLTDIQMPIMSGLELLAAIRQNSSSQKAETPVMALTANVLREDRDNYFKAGINDIVLKPFVERNLIEKVSLALRTKYANTDNLLFKYG